MSKKVFLLSLLVLFILTVKAQVVENKKAGDEDHVFKKVELEASTDLNQWKEHIKRKTQFADSLLKIIPAGTYTITVQFIIDKIGNVGDIKALNDPGYGLAKKAENVILSYKGEWKPASQCGRNVKAYRKQPITFVIQ